MSFGPSSALRRWAHLPICSHRRALNTDQNPTSYGEIIYYFPNGHLGKVQDLQFRQRFIAAKFQVVIPVRRLSLGPPAYRTVFYRVGLSAGRTNCYAFPDFILFRALCLITTCFTERQPLSTAWAPRWPPWPGRGRCPRSGITEKLFWGHLYNKLPVAGWGSANKKYLLCWRV